MFEEDQDELYEQRFGLSGSKKSNKTGQNQKTVISAFK